MSDLPLESGTENTQNSYTWNRFAELHKRWIGINRLREDYMMKIGTRSQIEMLFTMAGVPNLYSSLFNNLQDTKQLKISTTNFLKENTSEFN